MGFKVFGSSLGNLGFRDNSVELDKDCNGKGLLVLPISFELKIIQTAGYWLAHSDYFKGSKPRKL